jgi:hypothetical protein
MKIGIMQPYFFPYMGYFSLIKYVDRFVFFDTPQYINHGWVNRNRVLKQNGSSGYITVPVQKCHRDIAIKDIRISKNFDWREKIYGQLTVYKRRAPYYNNVIEFLHTVLDKDYNHSLANLNIETIKSVCRYLEVETVFDVFSEMDVNISEVSQADEWALEITNAIGGNIYVNLPGGVSFFDREKYIKQNIELQFLQSKLPPYIQRIGHFEKGLSIIDVMMFCNKKEISDMLNAFVIF